MNSLPNESAYSLATVQNTDPDEFSSLISPSSPPSYGSAPIHPPHHARRVVFNATCKMVLIFTLSCIFLGGTLWITLPTLEPYVYFLLCLPRIFTSTFPSKERTARCYVYQSLLLTFRISTTSSRNTGISTLSASSSPMSSLISCQFPISVLPHFPF